MDKNHPKVSKVTMAGRRYFQAIIAIIKKDLTAELRSRELISAMLIFSLLVILIFNFALELEPKLRLVVTPGILWVTFIFAGTIGLNRSLAVEKDRGSFDGLLLAPVDRSVILFGKMAGNLIFMSLLEILILPVYSLLYNVNLFQPGLLLVIFLGSVGYISVGTLLSSMSMQTKTRDMLLPIILFPVTLPILLAAVRASNGYLQNLGSASVGPWINLLVVYDVIFLAVSYMVFDYIVEE